eukprot:SAG22_NODE_16604_length_321_cov_7.581081_1_plen_101_part_01
MHDASDCEESFRAEDVETVEDVTFLVSHADDMGHMGIEAHHVAKLWPALQTLTGGAEDAVGGDAGESDDSDEPDASEVPQPETATEEPVAASAASEVSLSM